MRYFILAIALCFLMVAPRADAQQDEIRRVISSQIEAFQVDDFTTAFEYAHPNIQGLFGTPQNFGRMVQQGYPMVWRPSDVKYRDLRVENGQTFQDVDVVDSAGRAFLLEYSMTQTADGWRISGVRVLKSSQLSV
ncbi:MAG: DUF4864 domain-containing protein [Paracoccaceae bacterium]